ncbi:hypothetical protein ACLBWT_06615 [Paenibacillus sp. D51F]
MLQPMTSKEIQYISDSMTNEDLLMKQCACMATSVGNPGVSQLASRMVMNHQQNYAALLNSLYQHQTMAPSSPQS